MAATPQTYRGYKIWTNRFPTHVTWLVVVDGKHLSGSIPIYRDKEVPLKQAEMAAQVAIDNYLARKAPTRDVTDD